MRREDLFYAIGMVDDEHLIQCEMSRNSSSIDDMEDLNMHTKKKGFIKKTLLIAAIIVLMLALMGSAVAIFVTMRTQKIKMYQITTPTENTLQTNKEETAEQETIIPGKIYEGEIISFDEVQNVFIELGSYYPQLIPDGYIMTFVSNDAPLQNQVIHYENEKGSLIKFWIYVGDPASNIEIYDIVSKDEVLVNGHQGILYEQKGGGRLVVWIDEKQGYGFALLTYDTSVDLLAMAESTAEGERLEPTLSAETMKVLEELGDWNPQYLPEGFEELNVQGFPIVNDGWYSYVRKWYVNKAEDTQIYLEYETYSIITKDGYTDDARTACSFYIPGYHILKGETAGREVDINGMFGIASENDIAWADPKKHIVYHLYSEDIIDEELLKVAQNIIENTNS